MWKKQILCLCTLIVGLLIAGPVFAAFPDKPITLVVPFGAGGATDMPARIVASMLEKKLGQPIVVQNVVGSAGTQGIAQVLTAKPDGYTIGYAPLGAMCLQPHVQKLPYGRDDVQFLGMAVRQPVVIMASKLAPWKNFKEMVEIVRKEPDKYIVGITGSANATHIPMVQVAKHFNLKLRYMPYRSSPELMKDMISGRIHLHADTPTTLSQFDIYGLAQFMDPPAENLNLPSMKSLGYDKNMVHWHSLIAPKDLPKDIAAVLVKALQEVVTSKEFAAEAVKLSVSAHWLGPDEMMKHYQKEFDEYGVIIKELTAQ